MTGKKTSAYFLTLAVPTPGICLKHVTVTRNDQNSSIHAFEDKNSTLTYSNVSVLNRLDTVGDFTGFLDVVNNPPLVRICGYACLNPF